MKSRLEECNVSVQFVSPVTDSLDQDLMSKQWGLTITNVDGDRSAFVPVGEKEQFEKLLSKMDDDPLRLMVHCFLHCIDEVADDLFNEIIDGEEGFILNGEYINHSDFETVFSSFGEQEGERIGKKNRQEEIQEVAQTQV